MSGIRAKVLAGIEHQEIPFELLVERLGRSRRTDAPPIFQTTLNLQRPQRFREISALYMSNEPAERLELGELLPAPFALPGWSPPGFRGQANIFAGENRFAVSVALVFR